MNVMLMIPAHKYQWFPLKHAPAQSKNKYQYVCAQLTFYPIVKLNINKHMHLTPLYLIY
jgi:hypothetical protein